MDGFTACPETRHYTTLATMQIEICRANLTHAASALLYAKQRAKLEGTAPEHPCARQRAKLTRTAPAHPCARGVPFILNIILNIKLVASTICWVNCCPVDAIYWVLSSGTAMRQPHFCPWPVVLSCSNPFIPLDFVASKYYRALMWEIVVSKNN